MSLDCVFQLSPTEVRLLPSQREEGTEALSSGVIIFQRDDSQVSVQNASVFRSILCYISKGQRKNVQS